VLLQGFIGKNAKIRIFRSVWLHSISLEQRIKYLLKVPGIHMKIAMKYLGGKNKISIESARYLYEKCNEISWG